MTDPARTPDGRFALGAMPIDRAWAKVDRRGTDDCWPWTGSLNSDGYPQMVVGGRKARRVVRPYRLIYEAVNGPLVAGMTIDHECHNGDPLCPGGRFCLHRRCCNPTHLVQRTNIENIARATQRRR